MGKINTIVHVYMLQIYQVVRKTEFVLVPLRYPDLRDRAWQTKSAWESPRVEHFSRPDDGDKIKGALFLQRSVADAIKKAGALPVFYCIWFGREFSGSHHGGEGEGVLALYCVILALWKIP